MPKVIGCEYFLTYLLFAINIYHMAVKLCHAFMIATQTKDDSSAYIAFLTDSRLCFATILTMNF